MALAATQAACTPAGATAPGEPATPSEPEPPIWEEFATVRSWEPVNRTSFVSVGHAGGRYLVDVRVSPEARNAYAHLVRDTVLPTGTVVAKFHRDRAQGAPGPVYVMTKKADGWDFSVLTPEGRIQDYGRLGLCRRCHAEASADPLFGLPRSVERAVGPPGEAAPGVRQQSRGPETR